MKHRQGEKTLEVPAVGRKSKAGFPSLPFDEIGEVFGLTGLNQT
jgi:hypothetical protein